MKISKNRLHSMLQKVRGMAYVKVIGRQPKLWLKKNYLLELLEIMLISGYFLIRRRNSSILLLII